MDTTYSAGSSELRHLIVWNFCRSNFDDERAMFLVRFIEFWCQKNCLSLWGVEKTQKTLTISFSEVQDVVLFKLAENYDFFDTRHTIYMDRENIDK